MIEFKDLDSLFNFLKRQEKYSEEKLKRDLELAQGDNYHVECSVRSRGALRFSVPDLRELFGSVDIEAGVAVVEGFGRAKIKFKESFSKTPGLVETKFGFWELKVPWVVIEWRTFGIWWVRLRLPVPRLTWMKIRLPTLCFLMNVSKDGFEVFNVVGRTHIAYMAIGY